MTSSSGTSRVHLLVRISTFSCKRIASTFSVKILNISLILGSSKLSAIKVFMRYRSNTLSFEDFLHVLDNDDRPDYSFLLENRGILLLEIMYSNYLLGLVFLEGDSRPRPYKQGVIILLYKFRVLFCLKGRQRMRSILACCLVHSVSFLILIVFIFSVSKCLHKKYQ